MRVYHATQQPLQLGSASSKSHRTGAEFDASLRSATRPSLAQSRHLNQRTGASGEFTQLGSAALLCHCSGALIGVWPRDQLVAQQKRAHWPSISGKPHTTQGRSGLDASLHSASRPSLAAHSAGTEHAAVCPAAKLSGRRVGPVKRAPSVYVLRSDFIHLELVPQASVLVRRVCRATSEIQVGALGTRCGAKRILEG
jgi:hypothetical protein